MKEIDVAKAVVDYLENELGLEVYQEVLIPNWNDAVADIVAIKDDGSVWIVEVKTRLSWELLGQAADRKPYADFVSVAVPYNKYKKKRSTRALVRRVLRSEEIGMIAVGQDHLGRLMYSEDLTAPKLQGHMAHRLKDSLSEAQKTFSAAGTPGGGHWTPFKATCAQFKSLIEKTPGLTAREVVDRIDHHYASDKSARSNLTKRAVQGIIDGVVADGSGDKIRFYPKDGDSSGQ